MRATHARQKKIVFGYELDGVLLKNTDSGTTSMLLMTTSNSNRYLVVWTCIWVATHISTSVTSRTMHKCSLRRDAVIHTDTDKMVM